MHKVMLITGTSRGIGAATARLAAQRGYHLLLNYRSRADQATAQAREVAGEGIRVNAAGGEPGRIERLKCSVPLQRGGEAGEVAKAILWLVSEQSSYCTGTFIDVSGGR